MNQHFLCYKMYSGRTQRITNTKNINTVVTCASILVFLLENYYGKAIITVSSFDEFSHLWSVVRKCLRMWRLIKIVLGLLFVFKCMCLITNFRRMFEWLSGFRRMHYAHVFVFTDRIASESLFSMLCYNRWTKRPAVVLIVMAVHLNCTCTA